MDIFYTNETLYVNIDSIDENTIIKLKRRIYRILEDYGINKVELNINGYSDKLLLSELTEETLRKYQTTIKIK